MAMPAWYMDMWVKAPLPVISPMAQTPSAARILSSTLIVRSLSFRPTAPMPSAARRVRRPVATSNRSAVMAWPLASTVKQVPSWLTRRTLTSVRIAIPSAVKIFSISSLDSGSSSGSSRGVASITVTVAPKRAKTWLSSAPMAPPPSTTSDRGTCSVSIASRLVQ